MKLRPEFYLVARREFLTRIRSRFFQIGTVVMVVVIGVYLFLQTTVLAKGNPKVVFVGSTQALAAPLQAAAKASGTQIDTSTAPDEASGEAQIKSGKLDAVVSGDLPSPTVTVKDSLDPTVEALLNALLRQIAFNQAITKGGLNPAAVEAQVASAHVNVHALDPNAAERTGRTVTGIFVAALLYTALVIYGQIVAQGVVEEKANRIIEILVAAVPARQLLFGKVIGIGLVGVIQLAVVGLASLLITKLMHGVSIPSVGPQTVAYGLVWFVLGFVSYALLYAAGGSLVSRNEDIPTVTTPITILVVGTYLALFWVIANPDRTGAAVLSMLPMFAPIIMPARIATGDAQLWQVAVAVVGQVAAIFLLNALAARIYTNSVLRTGARVSIRVAWGGAD